MTAPEYEAIRYEVANQIATVTLSRPEKLNAFNGIMIRELLEAFDRIDADDGVRVAIFTGAGRGFSAGADMSRGERSFIPPGADRLVREDGSLDYGSEAVRDLGGVLALRLFRMLKPVIAAVNGPAVGLGATILLATDIRLASEAARFGFVFARRGMVPEAASSFFLPRIVGISRALEWCYSARLVEPAEAFEAGLVRSVHAPSELLPAAEAMARGMIEGNAPVSIALIRQMLWQGLGMTHPMEAHRVESRGIVARGRSADAAEGVSSFLAKRTADFPDRVSDGLPGFFPWWTDPDFR